MTDNLPEILSAFAEKHNIIAGACHAAPIDLERLTQSLFVPFVSRNMKKRTNPAETLPDVQSIIVIGVGEEQPGKANLSALGTNPDYHIRVKNFLRMLAAEIHGDFAYKILVDSPGLDERTLAERAGLGFFGRHGLIISQKFGSRFNIGCMLTNLLLPENFQCQSLLKWGLGGNFSSEKFPPRVFCHGCDLCIRACPTGALGGGSLDAARCISYLTQKEKLSPEEESLMHGQLYGCDICQNVCPFNAPISSDAINPQEWLNLSDDEFRKIYGHTAMLWRGADILRRNAGVVS